MPLQVPRKEENFSKISFVIFLLRHMKLLWHWLAIETDKANHKSSYTNSLTGAEVLFQPLANWVVPANE